MLAVHGYTSLTIFQYGISQVPATTKQTMLGRVNKGAFSH
jgi:hypothetical protein